MKKQELNKRRVLKEIGSGKSLATVGSSEEEIVEYCQWLSRNLDEELSPERIRELLKKGERWARGEGMRQHSLDFSDDLHNMPDD